ncbi:hypothetical protein D9758_007121 [Tetrapyrgos nigripes]|uniref:Transcription factor CBF/NF-Y/archaeal histone domain-containing protein n=1 Tax=Tetrapyrgos nigripes TaxID=182062 RepID=A0A8H5GDM6_9AGAR|nr:hypothetical protein D9758_007121 [Tetrapyrgos nigripes]
MAEQETQEEVYETAELDNAENDADEGIADEGGEQEQNTTTKKKREAAPLVREAGKSLLPFTRVQKIIKADKDIPIIARDATFLISLATEEFIKRLCQAGQRTAEREKRTTVQNKDLVTIVRKADEFLFLEEIISSSEPQTKRVPKAAAAKTTEPTTAQSGPTLLDQFIKTSDTTKSTDDSQLAIQSQEVVINEDGTMESLEGTQS